VEEWLASRDSKSEFAYVVTPNVDHIVRLNKSDANIRKAYLNATLCVCDSRVLMNLASICGVKLTLVPGSDLVQTMFDTMLRPGDCVCLIGGRRDYPLAIKLLYPEITVMHFDPPMGVLYNPAARAEAIDFVRKANARVILVGIGSLQQVILAYEMSEAGDIRGTALCIGAAVDFVVGTKQRAPVIWQKMSLEWLWRLREEPRRLARRYLVQGPAIFPIALLWRLGVRRRHQSVESP